MLPKIELRFGTVILCQKHLTLASTNPKYYNRLLDELRVQYKKTISSIHAVYIIFFFTKLVIQQTICLHSLGIIDVIMSASDQEYPVTDKHSS
jgi:hypothetical protein